MIKKYYIFFAILWCSIINAMQETIIVSYNVPDGDMAHEEKKLTLLQGITGSAIKQRLAQETGIPIEKQYLYIKDKKNNTRHLYDHQKPTQSVRMVTELLQESNS